MDAADIFQSAHWAGRASVAHPWLNWEGRTVTELEDIEARMEERLHEAWASVRELHDSIQALKASRYRLELEQDDA